MNSGVKFNFASVMIALVLLSGCVTPTPESPEVACGDRAQAWLDALMASILRAFIALQAPLISRRIRQGTIPEITRGATCGKQRNWVKSAAMARRNLVCVRWTWSSLIAHP